MNTKKIELIAAPRPAHFVGDGFRVHNFIPSGFRLDMKRMDPFIMMDYNSKFYFEPSQTPRGVGVHPHRGFETVTIAYQGKVEHHDSAGGGGIIQEGDVQWMTAGSGVLHKEYHETEWSKKGGIFQMVQLWVNLPSRYKMSPPKYQSIQHAEFPKVSVGENSWVEVIAGEYNGSKGIASTFSPIHMMNARLKKGASASFSFPAHFNTVALVIEGNIIANEEEEAPTDHLVLFENSGEDFNIEALDDAVVLILSGEPLNEPIAAHGPFVMNTRAEIIQAFDDFKNNKFGVLED
ncbi:pirin family protein [Riemerella anatipestifer]|uniref:Pirin domain protein n=1 Tax=Riemerella anatipestifer (strain ATCC 11845 / DSM 15868 / JCM 9532 / NCTC 11014) TaxID=693978 RepID=E4TDG1_RIEAD|nr:pirin family protein [Riemerella anatipestifer]ADQ82820.1 Pirin domain protein [Riemerella anatipestifer ATCC 11845 = DSM 15868]ADZ11687.1 Pirin-related protein [Riemerella anatipestifer RA-GD]AFD56830.1 pirin domain protein [Riemerella anatipestifer ATCC 11845 = DSM 15868]AGC41227.1 Pirin-related protein [Riemerella anatipestifer RA-CH-2]AKP69994.1 pirin domain-containing protein [Riemerella anatipestifer]